ncbi:MAG: class I SAM-dependent methyltransferase, partial [Alphaproteobacteria bacterium]|nr:class I SAM-dependent methyltransferase [Alphaproteobacteria bacterium]
ALLSGPLPQIAATRTRRPELIETYAGGEWTLRLRADGPAPIAALADFRPRAQAPSENPATRRLEDWIVRLLFVELREMGLLDAARFVDPEATRRRAGVLDKFDRWWAESLSILENRGLIVRAQGLIGVSPDGATLSRETVWRDWRAERLALLDAPETRTLATLVEDALSRLRDALTGRILVTDILFPGGGMEKIEGLYRNNRVCDYFNDVVAETACALIDARLRAARGARIRLLEIGAGTGGTTTTVLPHLTRYGDRIAEYCYSDLSRSFFNHARARYGDRYPFLDYSIFDAGAPLEPQGIAVGAYDLVLATNVLHATPNMRATLRNAKAALRAQGALILNEISDKTIFASVLFGLIDGWSLAQDEQWRIPGSPGLYPQDWRELMRQEGFG